MPNKGKNKFTTKRTHVSASWQRVDLLLLFFFVKKLFFFLLFVDRCAQVFPRKQTSDTDDWFVVIRAIFHLKEKIGVSKRTNENAFYLNAESKFFQEKTPFQFRFFFVGEQRKFIDLRRKDVTQTNDQSR